MKYLALMAAASGLALAAPGICSMSAEGAGAGGGGGGFDAKALALKSIAEITPALANATRADLVQLKEVEEGADGQKRSTLLDAIDTAIKSLDAKAQFQQSQGKTYTQAEVDKLVAAAVAKAKADAKSAPSKSKPASAIKLAKNAPNPTVAALTGMSKVVLVDDEDMPVQGAPTPEYGGANDFRSVGGGLALNRDIELDPGLPANAVAGAFLFAGTTPIGRAELVAPMRIGGGETVTLPAGSLAFTGSDELTDADA